MNDSFMPSEIGVYIREVDKLTEIEPEIVNIKKSGFLKSAYTWGIVKGHVDGYIKNQKSRFDLPKDAEIIIMTPEGTAITEYQLLSLEQEKDRRKFRSANTGMLGQTIESGTGKNAVSFDFEKIAPRIYKIRLESLEPGEYGFMPPESGKIYSFTIK